MANINEILARAAALRQETALNSIDPERAGGIMYDTLLALNELWLQQGAALVISKIYASVAAMNADTSPVSDLTGKPIRPGMVVVIASSDSDNGSVYRYNGTSAPKWSLVGKIGNITPEDSLTSDSTQLPLAAHQGKVLDGKISQLGQELSDGIEVRTFDHSTFTSPNDNIMVGESDIKFANVGDYLEIKVNPNGTSGYWLYRATSYNQPCMRFSSSNYLQIRFSSSANFTYQDAVNFNWNNIVIIKVVLTAINGSTYTYDIYADGVKVGTQDAGVLWFTQIGKGTIMDLYYIKLRIGGVERTLTKFGEMTGAVGVTDVYSSEQFDGLVRLNKRVSDLDADVTALDALVHESIVGEDMYFRFIKQSTLTNIQSHFSVYQRIKGNVYIAMYIGYYIYSGSAGHPNGYWRLERTNIGTFTNGEWTNIKTQAITAGENEFVLQWLAGSGYNFSGGFSGGFHYGEKIADLANAWVEFVADGNKLSTDADIPLTPCKSFYYREYSAIYQHNDNTIAAWHLKENHFRDGGYEVMNDVKFVQALDYFAYPGIVCVSRWLSEKAMPENVATITDMGDGSSPHYQFQSHTNRIHYEGNGYLCDVESEVLIGADDAQCDLSVYNGTDYNKYYRRNPDTAGAVDNRLKARTKVKISAM